MSDAISIADAITTELSAATLSQPIAAERGYLPIFDLEEMDDALHVTVVPAGDTQVALSRSMDQYDFVTEVGVQIRFPGQAFPSNENLDPYMTLVQEIRDFFRKRRLDTGTKAICTATEATYSDDHLERLHQFTALIKLRHRVMR